MKQRLALPVLLVPLALLALALAPGRARAQAVSVVMSNLDNPRGLAIGPDGGLYVTEAGSGGASTFTAGGRTFFYGGTSSVSRLLGGVQQRVVTGLPSFSLSAGGGEASGVQDIAFNAFGDAFVLSGYGQGLDPALRSSIGGVASDFGKLLRLTLAGSQTVADIAAYDAVANPDMGEVDSNPFGLAIAPNGNFLVADAGGNDLLSVTPGGTISTLSVFAPRLAPAPPFLGLPPGTMIPAQAVPTSVAVGPDGAFYVGQLTGFPFPQGGAQVYRVVPGQAPTAYLTGFTNIVDLAFDGAGSLYVLEYAANGILSGDPTGALIRVDPNGQRTTLLSQGLVNPTGIAIAPDAIYISNRGSTAGNGQVIRLAIPEPGTFALLGAGLLPGALLLLRRRRA